MDKMVLEMKVRTGEIRGSHLHSTQIPLFISCLVHFISKYFFEKRRRPLIRGKTFIFGKRSQRNEYNSLMNLVKNQRIIL
jgi:hypothetical protein